MARVPRIAGIETAIELYYSRTELFNEDILRLFPGISRSKVSALKKEVVAKMAELGTLSWNASAINTKVAYELWGLNIDDLEERYAALQELFGTKGGTN